MHAHRPRIQRQAMRRGRYNAAAIACQSDRPPQTFWKCGSASRLSSALSVSIGGHGPGAAGSFKIKNDSARCMALRSIAQQIFRKLIAISPALRRISQQKNPAVEHRHIERSRRIVVAESERLEHITLRAPGRRAQRSKSVTAPRNARAVTRR
jgi:hypothetical protein